MARTLTMTFFILTLFSLPSQGQTDFRVMSYNVENLFDTKDDPLTADNDFLPSGNRHWTPGRFYHKLQQLAKVITAAGEWSTPALVGLCEVENDSVLVRLLNYTPLRRQHYRYCMTHGQDTRGINVALLYQRDKFRYRGHTEHPVRFTRKQHKHTRNILHVWGDVITGDRIDVFVCHFPSRYGGEKESEPDRLDAARTLRVLCDSLHHLHPALHILIMGDFNDTPISYAHHTIGKGLTDAFSASGRGMGISYNENFFWFRIDHILCSPNIKPYNCTVEHVDYSDHYPMWCYLQLE